MKKIFSLILLLMVVTLDVSQAQLAKDSWAFGFGGTYPRFVSVNIQPLNSNYGAFLSIQRNFSENVGLRLNAGYNHMEGQWTNQSSSIITESTNLIGGNLDLLYYIVPCSPVSPYLFAGAGAGMRTLKNNATTTLDENETALSFNLGGGIEVALGSDWKLMAEYGYHSMFNSELDGAISSTEVNGTDAYMTLNVGLLYYFGKGEPSKKCEPFPQGMTMEMKSKDMTDYDKIDDIIKKHIPKEVIKEVVVDNAPKASMTEKWVLIGVNFDFNKSKLLPESYPILYDAARTLLKNPEMKVEIQGYTDNVGADSYNKKLGQARADVVRDYLLSKGVATDRLTAVSYGESNPVADNKTDGGRAMNRRIEFRITK